VNSVPSVLYLGKAEGYEREVRIICHGKSNFAELGASQMFSLSKSSGFKWLGECDATPEDIMNYNASKSREDKSKIDEAADFLTDLLAEGDVAATEAMELANEMGISKRTLERARAAIDVKAKRVDGHWVWGM